MGLICVEKSTLAGAFAESLAACARGSVVPAKVAEFCVADVFGLDSVALEVADTSVPAFVWAHQEKPSVETNAKINANSLMPECYSRSA